MKIVYVTVSFPFGPGEAFLIPELRELVARGHQLLIVPLRPGRRVIHGDAAEFVPYTRRAPLFSFCMLRGAAGAFCRNFRGAASVLRLFLDPRDHRTLAMNAATVPKGLWLSAIAREWDADHIHAYWASSVASAAFLAGECAHIPWSFTAHRHDIARNNLLSEKTRHAAFVRVISESGLRMLRDAVGDLASKAIVLHTGIEVRAVSSVSSTARRLRAFCPANLLLVKGHRYLIDAVSLLRDAGIGLELWLAGDGELRGQIERQIGERRLEQNVRLLGQMPHDALLSLYQKGEVDVVVLPSVDLGNGNHEGIPVSLMEAMAYAIPVIATETGGIPELIGAGVGVLVPPANPKALAHALSKLAASADLRRSLGLAGRKRVQESFEVTRTVSELIRKFNRSAPAYRMTKQRAVPATSEITSFRLGIGVLTHDLPSRARANIKRALHTACMSGQVPVRFAARWSLKTFRWLATNLTPTGQWFIAYRDKLGQSATLKMILPPQGDLSYADPFVYEWCGKHYIFFEAVSESRPPGEIWFVQLDQDGNASQPEPALTRAYHLSYPTIIEWRGETYLLPETSQNRSVELYRATEFPRRWELAGTLLSNVTALDSTLFERDGKLWLFTAGMGGGDLRSSELFLLFADSLFGPWRPHPKNPIVRDIKRARPAGSLFYREAELIRPSQDCSKSYGHAITLNRIETLSETDYRETWLGSILPDWATGLTATHTLNSNSRYDVWDGRARTLRYFFSARTRMPRLRWPAGNVFTETPYRQDQRPSKNKLLTLPESPE